jgi:hypothetical protein
LIKIEEAEKGNFGRDGKYKHKEILKLEVGEREKFKATDPFMANSIFFFGFHIKLNYLI